MSEIPSNILQAWIYGGLFTADDLAKAGGVTDSVFAKYRSGAREMPFGVAARISRYAQARAGRTELAALMNTAEFATVRAEALDTNGRIEDEVCGAVVALGDVKQRFEGDDLDGADRAVDELVRQAQAARAEISRRRGQIAPSP